MSSRPLALFEGYGIEIESMIVDARTLDTLPVADEVLRDASGGEAWVEDHEDGVIAWSNELVLHLLELKTNGPAPSFAGLAASFTASAAHLNELLSRRGARLMPTGMHPWMDPAREARLWPHDSGPVYRAYDRLFDCRRHGWANLQSVHLNLPFADEREFARLHAAVRVVLPLIPALAASSPFVEGRATGELDSRIGVYRSNAARTPAMSGAVIPDSIDRIDEYRRLIFEPIDRELRGLGADEALLGQEWTNARGAIARFDRMAVEIRLIDAQECARCDLAVAAAVSGLVRALVEERWSAHALQRAAPTAELAELLWSAAATGRHAPVGNSAWLALFGPHGDGARTLGDLLARAVEDSFSGPPELEAPIETVLRDGCLSERILAVAGPAPDRDGLRAVYGALCEHLVDGRVFRP